jgi:hypothetical protein
MVCILRAVLTSFAPIVEAREHLVTEVPGALL